MLAEHKLPRIATPLRVLIALAMLAILLLGHEGTQAQTAPTVSSVAVTSDAGSDDTYGLNDEIDITVTFSQAVTVTGTPKLKIDMDPAYWGEKVVPYTSGTGTASLVFSHTVVEPNISTQGIAVVENSLELDGGTIRSSSNVNATLAHSGLAHNSSHKVDWTTSPTPAVPAQPASCSVVLNVTQVGMKEAHLTWTVDHEWCDAGGHFVDLKGDDGQWKSALRSSSTSNHEYRHGHLRAGKDYEFRVRTIDYRGRNKQTIEDEWITTSNSVIISLGGISIRYYQHNGPGLVTVYWAPREGFSSLVDSIEGYLVRYRNVGATDWVVLPKKNAGDRCASSVINCHNLDDLEHNERYQYQVGTEFTKDGTTYTRWGESGDFIAINEPFKAWWIDSTPTHNPTFGRIFMTVDTNYGNVSAICNINGGEINCPPRTLVSLDVVPGGIYAVSATALDFADQNHVTAPLVKMHGDAGGVVWESGASAGDDELHISWNEAGNLNEGMQYFKCTDDSNPCTAAAKKAFRIKKLDGYLVQYKKEGWSAWRTFKVDTSVREYTVSGLSEGTYDVRVIPCMNVMEITGYGTGDRPTGGTETGSLHRCWMPDWNDDSVTYKDDIGILRGVTAMPHTVTVGSSNTSVPALPISPVTRTEPTQNRIYGSFRPPAFSGRSNVSDYRVRYRKPGTPWGYLTVFTHPEVNCIYNISGECHNSSNYRIDNLTSGTSYEVSIRERNANGAGDWLDLEDVRIP